MARMTAPDSGVKVRMYRHGHGDCFLLAFPNEECADRPVFVLIDCGIKPGSKVNKNIDEIIDHIADSTDNHIDVVVITHEHQDHVSAFTKKKNGKHVFDKITFDHCWLAWTEDGTDELANSLRERFRDTLIALSFAQEKVQKLQGATGLQEIVADLLGTEIGDDGNVPTLGKEGAEIVKRFREAKNANPMLPAAQAAEFALKGKTNKNAMKYVRDKAKQSVRFFSPEDVALPLPSAPAVKVYTLGPPRNEALLLDLDPKGSEKFHLAPSGSNALYDQTTRGFAQAVAPELASNGNPSPFAQRYCVTSDQVKRHRIPGKKTAGRSAKQIARDYLRLTYYGGPNQTPEESCAWRGIDDEWLGVSEGIALRLNDEVNNTSLVLAFELPHSGRVLLFTGDAQRGSWLGWSDLEWEKDDGEKVTAKDLLGRCIMYKVGHHGSHNATLNGTDRDDYANLGWMARGAFADEFVAMIPANTEWAMNKRRPWRHPLPEIEAALQKKARGRVFRSDRNHVDQPDTSVLNSAEWQDFSKRTTETDLFFDYVIEDK